MKAEEVNWVGKECFPCSSFALFSKEPNFWLVCMFKMPRFHVPPWNVYVPKLTRLCSLIWLYCPFLGIGSGYRSFSLSPWSNPLSLLALTCSVIHGCLQQQWKKSSHAPVVLLELQHLPCLFHLFFFVWETCGQLLQKWRNFKFCTMCFIYWTLLWLVNLESDYTVTWEGPSRMNPMTYF